MSVAVGQFFSEPSGKGYDLIFFQSADKALKVSSSHYGKTNALLRELNNSERKPYAVNKDDNIYQFYMGEHLPAFYFTRGGESASLLKSVYRTPLCVIGYFDTKKLLTA